MHWILLASLIVIIAIVVFEYNKKDKENFTSQEETHVITLNASQEESLQVISGYVGYMLLVSSACCLLSCLVFMYFVFIGIQSTGK